MADAIDRVLESVQMESSIAPALAARGVEHGLFLTILSIQAAGLTHRSAFEPLLSQLMALHEQAGNLRAALERVG